MNFKKISIAMLISTGMAITSAQAEDQGAGQVTFTGAIIDAACSIHPDSVDQTVNLGQIAKSELEDGNSSNARKFDIKLENCVVGDDEEGYKSVSLTFNGVFAVEGDSSLLALGSDTAKGAGIGISDQRGNQINFGEATDLVDLVNGDMTMSFSAYLKGLDDDKNPVTTGEFESITDFTLAYM